jgi:peroxiredoxin
MNTKIFSDMLHNIKFQTSSLRIIYTFTHVKCIILQIIKIKKMKRILVVILIGTLLFSCDNEEKIKGFKIAGQISGIENSEIYLKNKSGRDYLDIDTAMTDVDGNFVFEGKIDNPEMCYIKLNDEKFISLFVEDSEIKVSGNIEKIEEVQVEGSLSHDQYSDYLKKSKHLKDKGKVLDEEYYKAKEEGDTTSLSEILTEFEKLYEEENAFNKEYMKNNTSSVVTPYLAHTTAYALSLEDLKEITSSLDTALNNTIYVKLLNERIEVLESTAPGKQAIDFTQNDADGNPISLSSFKGKFLLVDFWASWCGPCRRENPNVVKVYEKFNDKGFEILGVSFDSNKKLWLDAIEKDGLTWSHVSDLTGWENAAGKIYGIRSIPHTMLIDPDGVIIAHKLTCEELEEKLEELLSDKRSVL